MKPRKEGWMGIYWMYSMLILALGERETASKASLDKTMVDGHGLFEQKSTTVTSMVPSLHGLLFPLKHFNL